VLVDLFCPGIFCESIYQIDLDYLKEKGIKGLIVDFDNTLVERGSRSAPETLHNWLEKVDKQGFGICIVSNNLKRKIGRVTQSLDIPLVASAGKPRGKAFYEGMKVLKTTSSQTAVIGDQLFTDVFGGNRLGLLTILVSPVGSQEMFHTKLLRYLERLIIKRLRKRSMIARF
jgi:HAD superfamily phosphatase (TIGR01668 family)